MGGSFLHRLPHVVQWFDRCVLAKWPEHLRCFARCVSVFVLPDDDVPLGLVRRLSRWNRRRFLAARKCTSVSLCSSLSTVATSPFWAASSSGMSSSLRQYGANILADEPV